ncbi:MAG: glycosyltransferase [Methylobacterium frigidaeris]
MTRTGMIRALRGQLRALRDRLLWRLRVPADFDPDFYRSYYRDVPETLDRPGLRRHFGLRGRREGRAPSAAALLAGLEARFGPVPADFRPDRYRLLHPDLMGLREDHALTAHYLQFGVRENRAYLPPDSTDQEEYERAVLARPDAAAYPAGFEEWLDRHGLGAGDWLLAFNLGEFVLLNADWLPETPRTRLDGLMIFVEAGLERIAPISLAHAFDPAFHRAAYPQGAGPGDPDLYRRWLATGLRRGESGSEAAHLRQLLGEDGFPSCFDPAAYARRLPDARRRAPPHRVLLLDDFLGGGFAYASDAVSGPGAGRLFEQAADRHLARGDAATARAAIDRALAAEPATPRRLHKRATALRLLGREREALADAVAASRLPGAGIDSHILAAESLAALPDEPDAALDQLERSAAACSVSAAWRDAAHRVLRRSFAATREQALALHRAGRAAEAEARLDGLIARLRGLLPQVDPLPAPLPPVPEGPVVVLCPGGIPPASLSRRFGAGEVRALDPDAEDAVPALNAARRVIVAGAEASPPVLHAIMYARGLGLPVQHADDESASAPADGAEAAIRTRLVRLARELCDAGFEPGEAPAVGPAPRRAARSSGVVAARPHADAPVTLFCGEVPAGLAPVVAEALDRHPTLRLAALGRVDLRGAFRAVRERVHPLGNLTDADACREVLAGCDINLVPAGRDADDPSGWHAAAQAGLPSVVTAAEAGRWNLRDGHDAVVADGPGGWRAAIDALAEDTALRRRIGEAARAAAGVPAPSPAPGPARRAPGAKPRLMLVNVFAPPQTLGGATRVFRDNIDDLLDRAGDRFDLMVVATDHGADDTPYRVRLDAYRGIPVARIAAPQETHRDWRPFNPAMAAPFGALLDRFAPDLVHLHCIQRLTGTVLEAVQERGIPAIVTLHDAWWISDFQFLADEDGRVLLPSADTLATPSQRTIGRLRSIARRRGLARLLDGAAALLAVSDPFADLYRAAGHPRTIAVPNGVPPLAPVAREPRGEGPVRLGHVGGRSAHKGAALVESVLRASAFGHLTLTLVDLGLDPGTVRDETWGTTPVRIVGPVPAQAVSGLYAGFDVLLAPSLWPESFGLVTREARAAGLWVVASDRGAIGEDIREGVDGFRVDVATGEPLRTVLAGIDADPDRFRRPPPAPEQPMRSAADQGRDLLALYDRLLAGAG